MKKKMVSVLLAILVIGSSVSVFPAIAAKEITQTSNGNITLFYTHLNRININFKIENGQAICEGGIRSTTKKTKVTAVLKKSKDGKTWTNVASWSSSDDTGVGASLEKTKSVSKGYEYSLTITGRALDNNGNVVETASKSAKQSYK